MNGIRVVTKCCICGRVKTDRGWQYGFTAGDSAVVYSHGVCPGCYDLEIMKAKMRLAVPALAGLR